MNIPYFWLLTVCLLSPCCGLFAQKQIKINGFVRSQKGDPIPFASIYSNNRYGTIADEHGTFFITLSSTDSLKLRVVGFKSKALVASSLINSSTIILDSLIQSLPEMVVKKTISYYKIPKKGRITRNHYVLTTNFWHGTLINDKNFKNKQIKSIEMKIGFKGDPILPFRLGVFTVDERGFPKENILKKDVIFYPKKKYGMQKINLENQNLILTDDKICIALELINTSNHLLELNDKYTPYIGLGKMKNQSPVFITNKLGKWVKLGNSHPVFIIELE